jgi:hypothetical protein
VAVYILEESISQLIKTEKNQTPKPMPFFSLTEKTDLNERDMIKPDESSLQMTEETVRLTNREFFSIICFFLIVMFVFYDENCTDKHDKN